MNLTDSMVLETRGLGVLGPNGIPLSEPVDACVGPGGLLLVTGPNGAGKTSFLRCALGLSSRYEGKVIRGFGAHEAHYLPQLGNVRFLAPLTLREAIALKVSADDDAILDVGLLPRALFERPWNDASGGERQRALLTAAFLSDARILALDEPFNHLDDGACEAVLRQAGRARAAGAAIVVVSHERRPELDRDAWISMRPARA